MGSPANGTRGGRNKIVAARLTASEEQAFLAKCGPLKVSQAARMALLEWPGVPQGEELSDELKTLLGLET